MRLLRLVGLTLPVLTLISCQSACRNPLVRREWRSISTDDRVKYIEAVKCLMNKPAQTSTDDVPGVTNRYDDFLGTHIVQADDVHFVGVFYPYHRLMMHLYEQELHSCGWQGGMPYWDWVLDVDDFFNSPLFDTESGFGGNGDWVPGNFTHPAPGFSVNTPWDVVDRTGGGCIQDGPFKGLQTHMGPADNTEYNPQCVRRDFAPDNFANMSGPASVEEGMSQVNYGLFDNITESTFHSGGHWGVGGLYGHMTDKWVSPADPLFYVHHTNLDRAWWSWQMRDLETREEDISGPLVQFDWDNSLGGNITLNHEFYFGQTVRTTSTVREMMHIQKGRLCYTYDKLY